MLVSSCIFFISTHTHSFYHSSSIQSSPAQSAVCKKSILLDLLIAKKQRQGRIKKVWLPIVGMQLLTSLFCGKLFFFFDDDESRFSLLYGPNLPSMYSNVYEKCSALHHDCSRVRTHPPCTVSPKNCMTDIKIASHPILLPSASSSKQLE